MTCFIDSQKAACGKTETCCLKRIFLTKSDLKEDTYLYIFIREEEKKSEEFGF